jgi:hypothetical protein
MLAGLGAFIALARVGVLAQNTSWPTPPRHDGGQHADPPQKNQAR